MEDYKSHNVFKWQEIYKENFIQSSEVVSMDGVENLVNTQPHPPSENIRLELGPPTPGQRDVGPLRTGWNRTPQQHKKKGNNGTARPQTNVSRNY